MKKLILILFLAKSMLCFSQEEKINDQILNTTKLIYFGIDFSHAYVANESPKHKLVLCEGIFQEMNLKFLSEKTGWLQSRLHKEILYEETMIHSLNLKYSDVPLIINKDSIHRILQEFPIGSKEGTGLVFLVTRMDKHRKEVELYTVFFDISTRTVIWMEKENGNATGGPPGLINFWYPKVDNAIAHFVQNFKDQKSERKSKPKSNSIFVKLLINEACLGYERKISRDMDISIEAGYRQNFLNSWHYESAPLPVEYFYRFLCFRGFTFRFDIKYKITRRSSIDWVFGYQRLSCPKIIWDPGAYAGTDDEEYAVWKQRNDEVVLQLIHTINIGGSTSPVKFFYGLGFKICSMTETYSIEGNPYNQKPSDKVVDETKIQPLFTFGLKIRLGSF